MRIGVPKEIKQDEYRVGMMPVGVELLVKAGHEVFIETGAGVASGFTDEDYRQVCGKIVPTHEEAFTNAVLGAIRKDPTIRVFYNRQLRRNGAKKAKVAAARKLAVAVYHMLSRRQPYRPAPGMNKQTTGKPVLRLGRP